MPSPLKSFFYIFVLITLFGLLVGTLNLLSPDLVHIPFGVDENGNPQSAEGLDGILTGLFSGGALGIFFGLVAAFFAWIFKAGVNKANDT